MTPVTDLLGRLVSAPRPQDPDRRVSGQVIKCRKGHYLVKPSSNDKAFWAARGDVTPEWVDRIGEALKKL